MVTTLKLIADIISTCSYKSTSTTASIIHCQTTRRSLMSCEEREAPPERMDGRMDGSAAELKSPSSAAMASEDDEGDREAYFPAD